MDLLINLKSLKDLVEKSPFTFPGVEDYIYIGNKTTKILSINSRTGDILSDSSNLLIGNNINKENNNSNKKYNNIDKNDIITLIRVDYILTSLNRNSNEESWHVSISEVSILDSNKNKFSKSSNDNTLNSNESSNYNSIKTEYNLNFSKLSFLKNELIINIFKFKEQENDNKIVSIVSNYNNNSTYILKDEHAIKENKQDSFDETNLLNNKYNSLSNNNENYNRINKQENTANKNEIEIFKNSINNNKYKNNSKLNKYNISNEERNHYNLVVNSNFLLDNEYIIYQKELESMYFKFLGEYYKVLKIKLDNGIATKKDINMYYLTEVWLNKRKELLKQISNSLNISNNIDNNTHNSLITDIDNSNQLAIIDKNKIEYKNNNVEKQIKIISTSQSKKDEYFENYCFFNEKNSDLCNKYYYSTDVNNPSNIFNINQGSDLIDNLDTYESLYDQILFKFFTIVVMLEYSNYYIFYTLSVVFIIAAILILVILLVYYIFENRSLKKKLLNLCSSVVINKSNYSKINIDPLSTILCNTSNNSICITNNLEYLYNNLRNNNYNDSNVNKHKFETNNTDMSNIDMLLLNEYINNLPLNSIYNILIHSKKYLPDSILKNWNNTCVDLSDYKNKISIFNINNSNNNSLLIEALRSTDLLILNKNINEQSLDYPHYCVPLHDNLGYTNYNKHINYIDKLLNSYQSDKSINNSEIFAEKYSLLNSKYNNTIKLNKIEESLILPDCITKNLHNKVTNTNVYIIREENKLTKIEKSEIVTEFVYDNEAEKAINDIEYNICETIINNNNNIKKFYNKKSNKRDRVNSNTSNNTNSSKLSRKKFKENMHINCINGYDSDNSIKGLIPITNNKTNHKTESCIYNYKLKKDLHKIQSQQDIIIDNDDIEKEIKNNNTTSNLNKRPRTYSETMSKRSVLEINFSYKEVGNENNNEFNLCSDKINKDICKNSYPQSCNIKHNTLDINSCEISDTCFNANNQELKDKVHNNNNNNNNKHLSSTPFRVTLTYNKKQSDKNLNLIYNKNKSILHQIDEAPNEYNYNNTASYRNALNDLQEHTTITKNEFYNGLCRCIDCLSDLSNVNNLDNTLNINCHHNINNDENNTTFKLTPKFKYEMIKNTKNITQLNMDDSCNDIHYIDKDSKFTRNKATERFNNYSVISPKKNKRCNTFNYDYNCYNLNSNNDIKVKYNQLNDKEINLNNNSNNNNNNNNINETTKNRALSGKNNIVNNININNNSNYNNLLSNQLIANSINNTVDNSNNYSINQINGFNNVAISNTNKNNNYSNNKNSLFSNCINNVNNLHVNNNINNKINNLKSLNYQETMTASTFTNSNLAPNASNSASNMVQATNNLHSNYIDEGRLSKTFSNLEAIGKGGFGIVLKGKHIIDENNYAIKIIKLSVNRYRSLMALPVIKEVKTMIKLNHKNVVRYTTCWFQTFIQNIDNILDSNQSAFVSQTEGLSLSNNYNFSKGTSFKNNLLTSKNKVLAVEKYTEKNIDKTSSLTNTIKRVSFNNIKNSKYSFYKARKKSFNCNVLDNSLISSRYSKYSIINEDESNEHLNNSQLYSKSRSHSISLSKSSSSVFISNSSSPCIEFVYKTKKLEISNLIDKVNKEYNDYKQEDKSKSIKRYKSNNNIGINIWEDSEKISEVHNSIEENEDKSNSNNRSIFYHKFLYLKNRYFKSCSNLSKTRLYNNYNFNYENRINQNNNLSCILNNKSSNKILYNNLLNNSHNSNIESIKNCITRNNSVYSKRKTCVINSSINNKFFINCDVDFNISNKSKSQNKLGNNLSNNNNSNPFNIWDDEDDDNDNFNKAEHKNNIINNTDYNEEENNKSTNSNKENKKNLINNKINNSKSTNNKFIVVSSNNNKDDNNNNNSNSNNTCINNVTNSNNSVRKASNKQTNKIINKNSIYKNKNKKKTNFASTMTKNNNKMTIYFFMQMEFCDGLTLNTYLDNYREEGGLSRDKIFNFFRQIVVGVYHMHKNKVIHRDLK